MTLEADDHQLFKRVEAVCEALKKGEMAILVDDESRENEGDVIFAAQYVDAEKINFMAKHARGLICLALDPKSMDKLDLPLMRDERKLGCVRDTAFTVSIEARTGVSTGISAADRARTIAVAASEEVRPQDLIVPGHIFPLRAQAGGVLKRAGHTEGSVDLCLLAGLRGSAVICEIMNDDGSMARADDLKKISEQFHLPMVSIPELIRYRLGRETHVSTVKTTPLKLAGVDWQMHLLKSSIDMREHIALVKGDPGREELVDVRVHVNRPLSDMLNEVSDSAQNAPLSVSLKELGAAKAAVFVFLSEENVELSLRQDFEFWSRSPQAKALVEPYDVESESKRAIRHIGVGSQILKHLGVRMMRLHVVQLGKHYPGLSGFGLSVVEQKLCGGGPVSS